MLIRSFRVIAAKLAFAAFAVFAFSAAAEAAVITFVASNGNDANACSLVTAPCKTLQRAVNVISADGTVRLLTPLVGGATLNKSIMIDGNGASIVGQIIVASPSAVVTLRGLALNGIRAAPHGIRIDSAAAVHIENCTIERYTGDGISFVATTATKLFVTDTVSRANSSDGRYADAVNAQVVIENSRFEQNFATGVYLKVASASVTGSAASGNGQLGIILLGQRATVTETTADNNGSDGFDVRSGTTAILNSAEATANGAAGLHVETGGDAVVNDCAILGSGLGLAVNNQGTIYTRQNNTLFGSASGGAPVTAGAY